MEATDFEMPSPKRQRTVSVEPAIDVKPHSANSAPTAHVAETDNIQAVNMKEDETDILDALMQHVESESTPQPSAPVTLPTAGPPSQVSRVTPEIEVAPIPPNLGAANQSDTIELDPASQGIVAHQAAEVSTISRADVGHETAQKLSSESADLMRSSSPPHTSFAPSTTDHLLQIDGIPPVDGITTFASVDGPEWEVDSSPYESSSDSDSSDDTSSEDSDDDDEEDADGDYAMLDPEEQARILMQGDGGSGDEGGAGKGKTGNASYRTANEQTDDAPPIPDVDVTEDMKIEELGVIEAIVENNILIRAKVSGEYQVLESGSLLCFADRKVAGVVAETLGRVEQPLYTMRFRSEQVAPDAVLAKGTVLYYVQSHSSFVFTQPLKAVKGSDASNIHDEEVGDDEMEFSDDEAEAEHKRQLKLKRQGRGGEIGRGRSVARGRGGRGGRGGASIPSNTNDPAYGNGSLEMNYDDIPEQEDGYNVLSRPANLHAMMNTTNDSHANHNHMPPPHAMKDRANSRGRGGDGRGRGRGNGRANFRGRGSSSSNQYQHTQPPQQSQQYQNAYQPPFPNQFPPPPPPPPMLTPHNAAFPGSFAPSPISPLPQSQFNFASAFGNPQFGNYHQQQQPGTFNPAMMQQFAQTQHYPPPQQNAGYAGHAGQWQPNQAAVAEVQRQLEEMRRSTTQSGQSQH